MSGLSHQVSYVRKVCSKCSSEWMVMEPYDGAEVYICPNCRAEETMYVELKEEDLSHETN